MLESAQTISAQNESEQDALTCWKEGEEEEEEERGGQVRT
jgi:hypothetical protein